MRKKFKQMISCLLTAALAVTPVISSAADSSTASAASVETFTAAPKRVSVHDPSIMEATDGTYYIFGTHITAAKSTDLVNWNYFTNIPTANGTVLFGNLEKNLEKALKWAGSDKFSVWAPDVFYNKDYVNTDGSKGAYMMYFCTSETATRSVIAYAVSQNVEGPYTMVDTLIYSGFNNQEINDINPYNYAETNIQELIANGTIKEEAKNNWFTSGGSFDNSYCPNAIDPTVFYGKDGTLWMTYGSWSGGIYVIEVDPATGKVKYPGTSSVTADGLVVDAYFGTRIGGGYTKSGEGPYILYDAESDYYYLYFTYEYFESNSGYNMRLFRSKNPDGPYLDAAGNNAALTGRVDNTNTGIKVMGNYYLSALTKGYKSPGHCSAFVDSDGQRYLFYHTRFDNSGEYHEVRVHQQFINENGWPVTAVFENKGDTISATGYKTEDITGDYEFINHGLQSDRNNLITPKNITLNADGTISGDISGTWKEKEGSYHMEAVIDGVTYSGVFFAQHDESAACNKVMTFTAIGTDNKTIWGVNKNIFNSSDDDMLDRAVSELDSSKFILSKTVSDIELPNKAYLSDIKWSSDNTAVITDDGKVTRPETATDVTLTATISYGNSQTTKTYKTTVMPVNMLPDYKYDFENTNGTSVAGSGSKTDAATLTGNASVSKEAFVGNVLTINNNNSEKSKNYLALPSDMFKNIDEAGFTVNMWVKFDSSTSEMVTLFEATNSSAVNGVPATAMYAGGHALIASNDILSRSSYKLMPSADEWNLMSYTVDINGIHTYINGDLITSLENDLHDAVNPDVFSLIDTVSVGGGMLELSGFAEASFDNIEFYSVALDADTFKSKYNAEKDNYPNFKLESSRNTIYAGGDKANTANITISGEENSEYTVDYSSSNDSVATVNSSGKVTAKKAGKTTITASITLNGETIQLTKNITVKKAYLNFSKKKTSIKVGKSATFKVKGYGLKANSIKWSSSKKSVLAVKQNGKATAKKAGKATITAKYKSFKVSVKVTVKK